MKKNLTARPAAVGGRAIWLLTGALSVASCAKFDKDGELAPNQDTAGSKDKGQTLVYDSKKDDKDYDKLVKEWTPYLESGQAGGGLTVSNATTTAFDQAAPNLSADVLAAHQAGGVTSDKVFSKAKIAPIWIAPSCVSCHVGGGRAAAPRVAGGAPQLLFRVSQPGLSPFGGPNPLPIFGFQIQPFAFKADSTVTISFKGIVSTSYVEQLKTLADGAAVNLRQPSYAFSVPLPANSMVSPRTAPQMAGTGLLEAVSEADILAIAQTQASLGSYGITGTPNYVTDPVSRTRVVGRFGWKANTPSMLVQVTGALNGDMGITSTLFSREQDGSFTKGGGVDIADPERLNLLAYARTLGVPALRNTNDPLVAKGRGLFMDARCAVCHVPVLRTSALPGQPAAVANQLITPFTDLLLHDMGPGLADGRPDFLASGSEWRTPPLWGLGLSQTTSGHTNLLHDGRARNVLEAIMWHDGEAAYSRQAVEQMSAKERQQLLAFLASL